MTKLMTDWVAAAVVVVPLHSALEKKKHKKQCDWYEKSNECVADKLGDGGSRDGKCNY